MSNLNSAERSRPVSYEDAYAQVQCLTDTQVEEIQGATVYSGQHPELGPIHIIIPAMGDGLLLFPFVLQQF